MYLVLITLDTITPFAFLQMTNTDANGGSLWGPFVEDALRLIDAPFLLQTPSNPLEHGHRQFLVKLWIRRASLVHIEGRDGGDTLLKLQQYIAVTPPEKRCPCEHGVELTQSADHFPECDAAMRQSFKNLLILYVRVRLQLSSRFGLTPGLASPY